MSVRPRRVLWPLKVSVALYIQSHILLLLKYSKTYTFWLKKFQLTSFVWRSFQYLYLIVLKYNTIRVKYMTILQLLKHVVGGIIIQIQSVMYHWIGLSTNTNLHNYRTYYFLQLVCQIYKKHCVATQIKLLLPLRVNP